MHRIATRLQLLAALALATNLLIAGQLVSPTTAEPRGEDHIGMEHFLTGLACVESSGRYKVTNPTSGAYGKYQIMPRNWRVWARRYLGDRHAEPTPENQEFVARTRIEKLYSNRGTWRRVAYWWLTGGRENNEELWSAKALGYVNSVMRIADRATKPKRATRVPARCRPRSFTESPDGSPPSEERVVVAGRSVYVRRGPGAENRLFAVARRGDVLTRLGEGEDVRGRPWLEVRLRNGRTGWIAAWYTRPEKDG